MLALSFQIAEFTRSLETEKKAQAWLAHSEGSLCSQVLTAVA